MPTEINKPAVFCISFDSVAMSGIIVEFLKIADIFYQNNYKIYLDLGYEIKADKNNFFRPYASEQDLYPQWINLIKTIESPFYQYSVELVEKILSLVAEDSGEIHHYHEIIESYSDYIAERFVHLWSDHHIKIVIVENGTLPENIIFTRALYKAIDRYGKIQGLNKYVLWRDHDLMWSSETHEKKYGSPPYVNTPEIIVSEHIAHVVLHEADYREMTRWCQSKHINILGNEFQSLQAIADSSQSDNKNIRAKFRLKHSISEDASLLARFTRIIPQKRIDREINLLYQLHQKITAKNEKPDIYLAIAGNTNEDPTEFARLQELVTHYNLNNFIIFLGELNPLISSAISQGDNIRELIIASDACCFMTSYEYESFGNPIAESICFNKPYITTRYKRYEHVYGDSGYTGLVFPISANNDGWVDDNFSAEVYDFLQDKNRIETIVRQNNRIMRDKQENGKSLPEKLNRLLDVSLIGGIENEK